MIGSAPVPRLRFEGARFDCGDKAGFLEANLAYALDPSGDRQGRPPADRPLCQPPGRLTFPGPHGT
jgi:hypothetical protein